MDGNKSARRRPSAGQKEWLSLLDESMITIAEGIVAQIWPIVSHSDGDGGLLPITCKTKMMMTI